MQEEQVKAEARKAAREASFGAPFRYWTPIGGTQDIVIVDEHPDFFRHEHALKNARSGKYDNFVPCIDENANCPVCAIAERPSYFAMYLTVIDLTGYVNKDGEDVEFSKKLLVVKPTQQKKIMRLYEKHKTLRGMILSMTRDDKESATIGNDIEFVEFMDEEELLTYETDYTDKEGKVHEVIAHEVYDYDKLFPEMTEKQLRAVAGGRPADAGSRESNKAALGDDWEEPTPARSARTATRRGAAPETEQDDAPAPAPRRASREAAPEPAAAPARRTRAAAPEQEEAAPPPRRTRAAAPAPAPEPAATEYDDDDIDPESGLPWADEPPVEDTPPPRRAAPRGRPAPEPEAEAPARSSVAARRSSLRR